MSVRKKMLRRKRKSEGIFKRIWKNIKKFWKNRFADKSKKENIFQYLFRQILISDSRGNPSIRTTVYFIIVTIIILVVVIECIIALSFVENTKIIEGVKTIVKERKGFSKHFIYLIITLSVVITSMFQSRENKVNGHGGGILETAMNYGKDKIKQFTNNFSSPESKPKPENAIGIDEDEDENKNT